MLIKTFGASRIIVIVLAFMFMSASCLSFVSTALAVDKNGCENYDSDGNCLDDFYISNDIAVDLSIPVCTTKGASITDASTDEERAINIGAERDYIGRPVINTSQISAVKQNQATYEKAAEASSIPWQMLAAIHLKTGGLKLENPENGRGVYQIPGVASNTYPEGVITANEFLAQSKAAAVYIKGKAPKLTASIKEITVIKDAFYKYLVGSNSSYTKQAKDLGFFSDFDGSPEVMNKVDEKRDPTKNPDKWGFYDKTTAKLKYPTGTEYGAYPIFATIAGISLVDCGGLVSGGMNLEKALEFMEVYKRSPDSVNYLGGAGRDCNGGPLSNCVSFSVYFMNKYTDLTPSGSPGNGVNVVRNLLLKYPDVPSGNTPQAYSVFSVPGPSSAGHTGIVLGVDQENGIMIFGDASCSGNFESTTAHSWTIDKFNSIYPGATYAYVSGYLKDGAL